MMRAFFVALVGTVFLVSLPVEAACRSYHYDHDGNPHTANRIRVVCEPTTTIRKIPKYVVQTDVRPVMRTRVQTPKHIPLPAEPRRCGIPSVYQFVQYQTKAQCMTD
jgi:hypothetical protein